VTTADLADRVGEELGVGDWMTIDQDMVDGFADITDDHQWIHRAGEKADNGPFGGPIAHGFLTLSLVSALTRGVMGPLMESSRMAINYGLDRVRFITPVPVGARLRSRVRLAEVKPIEGGVQLKNEVTLEIEGVERPAAVVESLVRLYD
jgi:acyl dehydratase